MSDYKKFTGGGVYLVSTPTYLSENLYKIGRANSIKERMISLHSALPKDFFSVYGVIYPVYDSRYTSGFLNFIEQTIHKKCLSGLRKSPYREFFTLEDVNLFKECAKYLNSIGLVVEFTTDPEKLKRVRDFSLDATIYKNFKIARPRDYQIPVLRKIVAGMKRDKVGTLVLPPGYGKSYMSCFLIKSLKLKRVLVLTPYLTICDDFSEALTKCGINNTVVNGERKERFVKKDTVYVTTYQTYLQNREKINGLKLDMIIGDEAHHICADRWRDVLIIPCEYKFFITATEYVVTGFDDIGEETGVFDMTNDSFGKILYKESVEESILNNRLCDYKLFFLCADDYCDGGEDSGEDSGEEEEIEYEESEIKTEESEEEFESESENEYESENEESRERCYDSDEIKIESKSEEESESPDKEKRKEPNFVKILNKLRNTYNRKKVVLFFNRVDYSKRINDLLNSNGINSFHVDAETSKNERESIFENFRDMKNNFTVICNVRVISEGKNIPCIDCIFFVEKCESFIGFHQKMGRGLRTFSYMEGGQRVDKDFCMVIIPEYMLEPSLQIMSRYDSRTLNREMCVFQELESREEKFFIEISRLVEIKNRGGLGEYYVEKIIEFVRENDRTPSQSKNGQGQEKCLSHFLRNIRDKICYVNKSEEWTTRLSGSHILLYKYFNQKKDYEERIDTIINFVEKITVYRLEKKKMKNYSPDFWNNSKGGDILGRNEING